MGCCLFACIGAIWPRITLVVLWLFTGITHRAFDTRIWPLLGFCFIPTTTLAWALCMDHLRAYAPGAHIDSSIWSMVIVGIGFIMDLGQLGMLKGVKDDNGV